MHGGNKKDGHNIESDQTASNIVLAGRGDSSLHMANLNNGLNTPRVRLSVRPSPNQDVKPKVSGEENDLAVETLKTE